MTITQGSTRIRPAVEADEARWRALWADFVALDTEKCPEQAADFIWRNALDAAHPMKLLMAEHLDEIEGFLLYTTHDFSRSIRPVCYLLDFYTAPVVRGRGLGRALIQHLGEIGRAKGWLKIYWMTQTDNAEARRLYDKFGHTSPLIRYDMHLHGYES